MRVLGKNVLVQQDAAESMRGSLFLPQGKEDYPNFGTVVNVGPGVVDVKAGDRVLFKRKPASAIWPEALAFEEGWGLLVLPDDHILAVVED